MSDDPEDDFVRTWWVTTTVPYIDRVVPADEIARANGTFVWPKPKTPKRSDLGLTWCRECGSVFDQAGTERTLCSAPCRAKSRARFIAARKKRYR